MRLHQSQSPCNEVLGWAALFYEIQNLRFGPVEQFRIPELWALFITILC